MYMYAYFSRMSSSLWDGYISSRELEGGTKQQMMALVGWSQVEGRSQMTASHSHALSALPAACSQAVILSKRTFDGRLFF